MNIKITLIFLSLYLVIQLGFAEEKRQLSYIEVISIFYGMTGYIDVVGDYCVKKFPELKPELQDGKKKFSNLHRKHIEQVKKIDEEIIRIIAEKHGEEERKEYMKYTKEEHKRQNDMILSDFSDNDISTQNLQCNNLVSALNQDLINIHDRDPMVSKMILEFK